MVVVPMEPWTMIRLAGEATSVSDGTTTTWVNAEEVLVVKLPSPASMAVMLYVPAAAIAAEGVAVLPVPGFPVPGEVAPL